MSNCAADAFDYVVVGSGAGGATVAARLAESGASVLVLEAGSNPLAPAPGLPDDYDVPAFHAFASENSAIAWNFYVRDFGDDRERRRPLDRPPPGVLYPRASTLGGCTVHNAMLFLATPDEDWNRIARLTGDLSWNASEMRRHFHAVDDCRYRPLWRLLASISGGRLDPSGHGWNGWLPSELALPHRALEDRALIATIREAIRRDMFGGGDSARALHAIKRLARIFRAEIDPNDRRAQGRAAEGFCVTPLSTLNGRRRSARERAFVAMRDSGLCVEFDALATRVILDKARAVGVEYLKGEHLYRASPLAGDVGGERRTVQARREIILCGGAFNTPQLLMLSGIGPPNEIEKVGLKTVCPLEGVGANLQDRYEITLVHRVKAPWRCLEGARFETGDPLYEDWRHGEGMYCSNGAAMAFKFSSRASLAIPDLFAMGLLTRFDGYYPRYSNVIRKSHADFSFALLKAYTGNRKGRVGLASADPRDPPTIDFNFFAEGGDGSEGDIAALVGGIKRLRRITSSLVEQHVLEPEDTPGAGVASDETLSDFVRKRVWGHHASCTCAIGPEEKGGALDSAFRIHGVKGLRVVDASIFPNIPGYFIVSAVYTIAEKAAAAILTGL
jgi:choline dehydrogenase-like flavoprotein